MGEVELCAIHRADAAGPRSELGGARLRAGGHIGSGYVLPGDVRAEGPCQDGRIAQRFSAPHRLEDVRRAGVPLPFRNVAHPGELEPDFDLQADVVANFAERVLEDPLAGDPIVHKGTDLAEPEQH